jgi:predicted HAD superfamily phosphohydrolase YqeG
MLGIKEESKRETRPAEWICALREWGSYVTKVTNQKNERIKMGTQKDMDVSFVD